MSFFTRCIWYINWSCWQWYITLSVLMFSDTDKSSSFSLYGTRVHWVNMGRGQPGSVSKFPPLLWVELWVGWMGKGYTEISRYFPASWINWVTLVTKTKLLFFYWDFRSPLNHQKCFNGMLFLRLKAWFYVQYTIPPPAAMLGLLSLDPGLYRLQHSTNLVDVGL